MSKRFNLRVYGLFLDDQQRLLVADEFDFGLKFTKFPGGGLEFGEGTIECIKRECIEEMGQKIDIISHFYTTDFFQESAFNPNDQLISIYYLIQISKPYHFSFSTKKFDFSVEKNGVRNFRFVPLDKLTNADLTFPIDKIVLEKLQQMNGIKSLVENSVNKS
jgi:8-oxo-dGTP diphosphatase